MVLFDIGGVLIRWKDEWTFRAVSRRYGLPYTQVARVILAERERLQSGRQTPSEFSRRVEGDLGIRIEGGFGRWWTGQLADHAEVNRSAHRSAARLRDSGIPTGIFSNTDPSHVGVFRRKGWFQGFEPWILSYEAGASKPAPEAYIWAEKLTGRKGGDLVLVDDRMPNVEAALQRGWRAIHYRNARDTDRALRAIFSRASQ